MDALDEFFSTWCAPEAWCERCGEHPALHVVRRNPAAKYGGFPTYVRVWDVTTQTALAVCRQCVKQQVNTSGEIVHQPTTITRVQPEPCWLRWFRRFFRHIRYRLHLHATKWWPRDDDQDRIPRPETLWR